MKIPPTKKRKRKSKSPKKGRGLRWLWYLVIVLGILGYLLFQIKIPVSPKVMDMVDEYLGGAFKSLSFSADKMSLEMLGEIQLEGVSVGEYSVITSNKMRVKVSFLNCLFKECRLERVSFDSIKIKREGLKKLERTVLNELKQNSNISRSLFKNFDFNIDYAVIINKKDEPNFYAKKMKGTLQGTDELKGKIQIKYFYLGAEPLAQKISFNLYKKLSQLNIEDLQARSYGGKVTGKINLVNWNSFSGKIDFSKIGLGRFSQPKIGENQILAGSVSGDLKFSGVMGSPEWMKADGSIKVKNAVFKNLPFQSDLVIKSYMPDLKSLKLSQVDLKDISLRKKKLSIGFIEAKGKPLYFTASGQAMLPMDKVKLGYSLEKFLRKSSLYLALHCHLTEDYYNSLSGLVKDGLYKDDEERPTFKCEVKGDLIKQSIYLEKVVGRVLKTFSRRMGRTFKNLFKK